jgi:hypothetical protein
MRASHKVSAYAFCMFALCYASASALAESVQGYVLEVGASGPKKGVSGVSVVVKDRFFGIVLGQTVTLVDGKYEMKIDGKQAATAVLFFDKVGYFKRETQQNMTDPRKPQAEVWLSREGMSGDYPKVAVANILEQRSKGGSAANFDPFFAAISSLPAKDKLEVFKELRLKDPSIYEKFAAADITYKSAEDFTTKLMSSKSADQFKGVGAYPNFGSPGTVRLYGNVPSNSNKREIEDLAKQVDGFKIVRSDLTVK